MSQSPWIRPLRPLGRVGESLLDRVLCVLGAVGLSQAPEFFQQYLQRLGGHLDEARRLLSNYETLARQSGITVRELIEVNRAQADQRIVKQGDILADLVTRVESLAAAETALREASVWDRPFVFLAHVDSSIAARTWEVFKPAVPVTAEGFVYAAVGMVLALALYQFAVAWPARVLIARCKKSQPAAAPKG